MKNVQNKIQKTFKKLKIISYPMDITNEEKSLKWKNNLNLKNLKSLLVNNAAINPKMKKMSKNSKSGTMKTIH